MGVKHLGAKKIIATQGFKQEEGEKMPEKNDQVFTQEEVDAIVEKRLARLKAESDKEKKDLERKHTESIEEYEDRIKSANMTAEEKHTKALEKMKKELEEKQSELTTIKTNEIKRDMLAKYKLSDKFLSRVSGTTEEEIEASVKEFSETIGEYMKSQGGGTPGALVGGSGETKGTTKEQFGKMSYQERVALHNLDKATYDALNKK